MNEKLAIAATETVKGWYNTSPDSLVETNTAEVERIARYHFDIWVSNDDRVDAEDREEYVKLFAAEVEHYCADAAAWDVERNSAPAY